jgi:protoporphyrinogen oxidase
MPTQEQGGQRAIIIGGGPAGLTAAYELLTRTSVTPLVLEASDSLGGISRTVNYKGNRIDIGGHRFFSKSQRVLDWWAEMLPLQRLNGQSIQIAYQSRKHDLAASPDGPDPAQVDEVMLVRPRKSRIYYARRFFDYPISLSAQTIKNLGIGRTIKIGISYMLARLLPIRNEKTLEQFLVNRFGRELFRTFFESYTEKVWGVPCHRISAAWGAQRIKGLSITKAVLHAVQKLLHARKPKDMKQVETSLIEQFLYPKFGPGQMWETCGRRIQSLGGEIRHGLTVQRLIVEGQRVVGVVASDDTNQQHEFRGDYVFSTMPIKTLVKGLQTDVPPQVRAISDGLIYRDFITVGLLVDRLQIFDEHNPKYPADNWIYVQEPDVQVGRLQIFNNWSPYMVADPDKVWIGLEYFCNEGDKLWNLSNAEMVRLGIDELTRIGILNSTSAVDSTVIRVPKTYPAYFGSYEQFPELRAWLDQFENLFLIGRNGMHRYNNQDHSMLTAMIAVDNILARRVDKSNIWDVNTEDEYHESNQRQAKAAT